MTLLSKSPERGSFQKEAAIKTAKEQGKLLSERNLEFFQTVKEQQEELESSDEWKKHNLEHDLRSTDWILHKAWTRDEYAQHVYAALCNTDWQKLDVIKILKEETWSCSWRHAGGIVADMLGKGDYIDWYCSGINNDYEMNDEAQSKLTGEELHQYSKLKKYVPEGTVTMEIIEDFKKMGWVQIHLPD